MCSWHKSARLNWHHFEVGFLAACSPDFNRIERLWLRHGEDYFADFIVRTPEELSERLCLALMNENPKVAWQCSISK
jgi:transposase